MTQELQELSRQAVKMLPEEITRKFNIAMTGRIACSDGWLHESTEACAEIMVKVLWPAGYMRELIEAWFFLKDEGKMRAFRVCVLRALIALKGTTND